MRSNRRMGRLNNVHFSMIITIDDYDDDDGDDAHSIHQSDLQDIVYIYSGKKRPDIFFFFTFSCIISSYAKLSIKMFREE